MPPSERTAHYEDWINGTIFFTYLVTYCKHFPLSGMKLKNEVFRGTRPVQQHNQ